MVVVNYSVSGYDSVSLEELDRGYGGDIFLVLDKEANYNTSNTYRKVKELLALNAKLQVIFVGEMVEEYKSIAALMATYNNYKMYNVSSIELIFKPYIDALSKRNPTREEVANLFDGEIIALSDVEEVLLTIENLSREGNIEGLKEFITKNINVINKMTVALNFMRSLTDRANTLELESVVEKLKEEVSLAEKKILEYESNLEIAQESIKEALKKSEESLKEVDRLTKANKALKDIGKDSSSGSRISKYASVNTSLIKCKVSAVIYFKEISYVRYVNSMVMHLKDWVEGLGGKKLRVKLLIYDDGTQFANSYAPINVIGAEEYRARSSQLIGKLDKFVVREPNPVIIEDILSYNVEPYDVVIIYDRMRQTEDIVIGNNVHKFYVLNGAKDLENMKGPLKIQDNSEFIVPEGSSIKGMQIHRIEGYENQTDMAKKSRYYKLKGNDKEGLFARIGKVSRINALVR